MIKRNENEIMKQVNIELIKRNFYDELTKEKHDPNCATERAVAASN